MLRRLIGFTAGLDRSPGRPSFLGLGLPDWPRPARFRLHHVTSRC